MNAYLLKWTSVLLSVILVLALFIVLSAGLGCSTVIYEDENLTISLAAWSTCPPPGEWGGVIGTRIDFKN